MVSLLRYGVVLLFCLCPLLAHAADVRLDWNAPSGPAVIPITGYRLHYGTASQTYTATVDVGPALTQTVLNLTPGVTYFFAASAYNDAGSGAFSNEVRHTIPVPVPVPGAPEQLRVTVTTIIDVQPSKP